MFKVNFIIIISRKQHSFQNKQINWLQRFKMAIKTLLIDMMMANSNNVAVTLLWFGDGLQIVPVCGWAKFNKSQCQCGLHKLQQYCKIVKQIVVDRLKYKVYWIKIILMHTNILISLPELAPKLPSTGYLLNPLLWCPIEFWCSNIISAFFRPPTTGNGLRVEETSQKYK